MAFYRTDDGHGWVHINFGRRGGNPLPCAAPARPGDDLSIGTKCGRLSSKLCDGPGGTDLAGTVKTCDMPICKFCAAHVEGQDLDYCPRHADLAR